VDNGFNLNMLLESLSEFLANKVAEKLEGRVNGSGRVTRLLTVEQAAAYLGRTKEAVQHIVASGPEFTLTILPIKPGERRSASIEMTLNHKNSGNESYRMGDSELRFQGRRATLSLTFPQINSK